MNVNPLSSLVKGLLCLVTGRLHFPRHRVGQSLSIEGETWVVFREAVLDPLPGEPEVPEAIFRPRFHVARLSLRQNILFSLLPMWFIFGLPGFRTKLWLYNPETEDFCGLYTWTTVEDAKNYQDSWAGRFMTDRSLPGSVSFQIVARKSPLGTAYGRVIFESHSLSAR